MIAGAATRLRGQRRRYVARAALPPSYFVAPALVLLAALVGYPMFVLVRMSFSDVRPGTLLGEWAGVGFENYVELFSDPRFSTIVLRTVIFGLVVLVLGLGGGLVAALVLRRPTRENAFVYALMVLMWALPAIVNGVTWRFMFATDGAINQTLGGLNLVDEPVYFLIEGWMPLLSTAFVAGWVALPFATIIFKAALLDVPRELYEAAEIDGAGPWMQFRSVTAPSISPTIYIVGILLLSWAVRSFDFIFAMTGGGPGNASTTLPVAGYLTAFSLFNYSGGAAIALLTIVTVLLIALPYARVMRRSE